MDNSMLEKYKEQALEMMRAARAKNPDYSTSSRSYFPSSMTRTDGRENFDDMEQDGNYINKNNQNTAVRRQNTITEDVNMPGQCFNDMNASVQTMNMMNKDEMMQSMRSGDMNSSVQSPDMSDQDIMMQPMRSRDMNSSVQSPGMSDQDIMMQPMRSRDMNSSVQSPGM
ncbi:MAG: hypothetical protein Q4F95_08830, partial [Oscillospiraceae bacterium]|nr:hypothetical protein [Oscillospiraceae bacterium]